MSQGSNASELFDLVELNSVAYFCQIALAALVFYEFFLTLDREIQSIWSCRSRSVIWTFYTNRVSMLALGLANVLTILPWNTTKSCLDSNIFAEVCILVSYGIWAVISALRVHAVTNRDWRVSLFTLLLGLVPVGTNLYGYTQTFVIIATVSSLTICQANGNIPVAQGRRVAISTHCSLIAVDIVVLLSSWLSLCDIRHHLPQQTRSPLTTLLLRNGTIYFVFLLVLNVMHIIVYCLTEYDEVAVFMIPLSSIMISRFMLDLRDVRHTSPNIQTSSAIYSQTHRYSLSHLSSMAFGSNSAGIHEITSDVAPSSITLHDLKRDHGSFFDVPGDDNLNLHDETYVEIEMRVV